MHGIQIQHIYDEVKRKVGPQGAPLYSKLIKTWQKSYTEGIEMDEFQNSAKHTRMTLRGRGKVK